MKRTIAFLSVIVLCMSMASAAWADEDNGCVVIGANLTDEQITSVYSTFGILRGSVPEIVVTNSEERAYLEGLIADSIIGHNSISCVYVKLRSEGSGMSIRTSNITWCTGDMYVSALSTAGISDAEIIVAAPFGVSGTAALTGIYKAYEYLTGNKLSEDAKQVSTEELTVTGDLSDLIGSDDATAIINELKLILDETRTMSDAELHQTITDIAASYGVVLDESEMQMVINLCRELEKLDVDGIVSRVSELQNAFQKISDTKEKVENAANTVSDFASNVSSFLSKVGAFFEKIFSVFK